MQAERQETLVGEGEAQESSLTNNRKDRQHHALAKYGNYRNYYFHRTATIPDARLSLLPRDLFQHKSCPRSRMQCWEADYRDMQVFGCFDMLLA